MSYIQDNLIKAYCKITGKEELKEEALKKLELVGWNFYVNQKDIIAEKNSSNYLKAISEVYNFQKEIINESKRSYPDKRCWYSNHIISSVTNNNCRN